MASGAVEKTADELRKEIQELQRQQREITERLRDPRGLRRAGLVPNGPCPTGGPPQRGVVRPAVESEEQPAPKRRLLSAVVKVDGGETMEEESGANDAKEKDPAGEVQEASGGENSKPRAANSQSNGGFRRDGNTRSRRMDFDIPTESVPRNLPKDEDPSLVKRKRKENGESEKGDAKERCPATLFVSNLPGPCRGRASCHGSEESHAGERRAARSRRAVPLEAAPRGDKVGRRKGEVSAVIPVADTTWERRTPATRSTARGRAGCPTSVKEKEGPRPQEVTDTEVKDSVSDAAEELDWTKPASSSGLDNGKEDDHQMSTHDDKAVADPKPEKDQAEANASSQEKARIEPGCAGGAALYART